MRNLSEGVRTRARVDFSAGHPDLQAFSSLEPGYVFNWSLDAGVSVALLETLPAATEPRGYAAAVCAALAGRYGLPQHALHISNSVAGQGLGSSGATATAIVIAYCERYDLGLTSEDICALSRDLESCTGNTCGSQDHLASVSEGPGLVVATEYVALRYPSSRRLPPELEFAIVRPVGTPQSTRQSGVLLDAILENSGKAAPLVKQMSTTALGMWDALADGDEDRLIEGVNESRALMQALHPDVVDAGISEAMASAGVLGAKPCGAGGYEASWMCLMRRGNRGAVLRRLGDANLGLVPVSLTNAQPFESQTVFSIDT